MNLPKNLQEKENYKSIQKKLFGILQSTHSHSDMMEWFICFPCQQRYQKFKEEKKKLGFRSGGQYLQWERSANNSKNEISKLII